ncbi:hypothetical protein [Streptomyces sp. NPDC003720]
MNLAVAACVLNDLYREAEAGGDEVAEIPRALRQGAAVTRSAG